MHRGGVIPHQEISDLPFVPVLKLRPQAVRVQLLDQSDALVVRQALDSDALAGGDVERLAARPGVGSDDGVRNVRRLVELLLRQLGPGTVRSALALGVTMDRLQSHQPSLHNFRQRLVCSNGVCEQSISQRASVPVWYFLGVQQRAPTRLFQIGKQIICWRTELADDVMDRQARRSLESARGLAGI